MPRCYDTSYAQGEFFQHVVAPYEFRVDDLENPRDYYGCTRYTICAYGCMRDEQGEMYEILRVITPRHRPATIPYAFLLQNTLIDGQHLIPDQETAAKAAQGNYVDSRRTGDKLIMARRPQDPGADWYIEVTDNTMVWHEDGIMHLEGKFLKPGCQWLTPGPDYSYMYVNNFVDLSGEINGKHVEGLISFDWYYMHPENACNYLRKDIVNENDGHIVWYMFANRYSDGTYDWGQFEVCHDRMGFGFLCDSEGNVRTTTDNITAEVEVLSEDNPFTGQIKLNFDDEKWVFDPDPKGAMPAMLKKHPPTPQQEGFWHKEDETRTPVAWFAWGETERKHGIVCQPKLPTRA